MKLNIVLKLAWHYYYDYYYFIYLFIFIIIFIIFNYWWESLHVEYSFLVHCQFPAGFLVYHVYLRDSRKTNYFIIFSLAAGWFYVYGVSIKILVKIPIPVQTKPIIIRSYLMWLAYYLSLILILRFSKFISCLIGNM